MSDEKKFIINFNGTTKGAIGVTYNITAESYGKNIDEAILNLYDRYERITVWSWVME